jgi:hypothetical protein
MANMRCKRKECIQERVIYLKGLEEGYDFDVNEIPEPLYDEYTLIHCEMSGCHQHYFKDKTGEQCNKCGSEVCEACADNGGNIGEDDDSYSDTWLCPNCLKVKRKAIIKALDKKYNEKRNNLTSNRLRQKRKQDEANEHPNASKTKKRQRTRH